jgi:L,D-peptidoglycan transpeptidase YkuD (ErfK/YbiS/YcfS/YnhG family)
MTVLRGAWPADKRGGAIPQAKGTYTMGVRRVRPIIVRRAPGYPSQARVQLSHGVRRAAIGRASVRPMKREGDGGTPLGRFPIRLVLYRTDRVSRPRVPLPVRAIRADDAWCDDPDDRNYNRLIRLSSKRNVESLMRDDPLYDYVLVLGYNDRPRIKGRGSAIFVHLARRRYTPTEGCIAFSRVDFSAVLAEIRRGSCFLVLR